VTVRPRGDRITTRSWKRLAKAGLEDSQVFEIVGDRFHPVYHAGDVLWANPQVKLRMGDHIVLRLKDGTVCVKTLVKSSKASLSLVAVTGAAKRRIERFKRADVAWIGRVVACLKA
jgi:phage repressor protein C with HTH and peptisase S24 domain